MKHHSLAQIGDDLRRRKISASALVSQAIASFENSEPELRAYKHWAGSQALQQAGAVDVLLSSGQDHGPLMGMPVSVKDLYGVPGMPVHAGTDTRFPESWERAGPLVRSLTGQLGIVMGKTHTVEFAFGGIGTNPHWGAPVNPWSSKEAPRVSGGSSSGAGVSLAQGSALLALGTDTAGSVRIPAAFTGQCALKTTHGRWPADGIVPLSPSLDTPGLLCRTVEDLAYAFSALDIQANNETNGAITPRPLAGLRIGVVENVVWDGIDPEIAANTEAALATLERNGASLSKVSLNGLDAVLEIFRHGGLAAPELRSFMDLNFPDRIGRLDPMVRARVEQADEVSAIEYLRRRNVLRTSGHAALKVFEHVDVLVSPTVPISAPLLSDVAEGDAYRAANMMALRNTAIVNLFGWCALTLPSGLDGNGIPSGLQLIAPPMREPQLLAMALGVENVVGKAPELLGPSPLCWRRC